MELTKTQKTIIRILLAEKSSNRSLLAEKLSLTNAALTLALKPLLSEGMIIEKRDLSVQKVGRKALSIELNPDYGSFLSIDIKKSHSYFYEMDFSGNLKDKKDDRDLAFSEFLKSRKNFILGIGLVVRGDASFSYVKKKHPDLINELDDSSIPYFVFNNVDCLADIYFLENHGYKNFLLLKYGPGVGSSLYVNGKPLGAASELGHTYYNGKKVESLISYASLLGKEMDEKEATNIIEKDEGKLNAILKALSFVICNADALLSFQKIILSGELLSLTEIEGELKEKILSLNPDFDVNKISDYPNYKEKNEIKGALGAFMKIFR